MRAGIDPSSLPRTRSPRRKEKHNENVFFLNGGSSTGAAAAAPLLLMTRFSATKSFAGSCAVVVVVVRCVVQPKQRSHPLGVAWPVPLASRPAVRTLGELEDVRAYVLEYVRVYVRMSSGSRTRDSVGSVFWDDAAGAPPTPTGGRQALISRAAACFLLSESAVGPLATGAARATFCFIEASGQPTCAASRGC